MSKPLNLWGDLPTGEAIAPPTKILAQQGDILEEHSGGLLCCKIKRSEQEGNMILLHFDIVAPLLKNYTFRILSLRHPVEIYPIAMLNRIDASESTSENEEAFLRNLGKILASDRVRQIVAALMAQSKAEMQ